MGAMSRARQPEPGAAEAGGALWHDDPRGGSHPPPGPQPAVACVAAGWPYGAQACRIASPWGFKLLGLMGRSGSKPLLAFLREVQRCRLALAFKIQASSRRPRSAREGAASLVGGLEIGPRGRPGGHGRGAAAAVQALRQPRGREGDRRPRHSAEALLLEGRPDAPQLDRMGLRRRSWSFSVFRTQVACSQRPASGRLGQKGMVCLSEEGFFEERTSRAPKERPLDGP